MVDEPTQRLWASGDGTYLAAQFRPVPPDLPSLDVRDLEPWFGTRRLDVDSRPLVIELAVDPGASLPLVRFVSRRHIPERDRYLFTAALIAPLATCSWVVEVGRGEGDTTGTRETLALGAYAREHPDRISAGGYFEGFDPYVREWDDAVPDELDPLTPVRRRIDEIEAALTFGPEVAAEPPFS